MEFRTEVLPQVSVDYLNDRWLDPSGRIRLLDAEEFRSVPEEHLRLWLHHRARYSLPTKELVSWLRNEIRGRSAIEIGAGNGDLGHHLGIPMTDSYVQQSPAMQARYRATGQPVTDPPSDVELLDALEAVARYRPQVVVASWVTRRFIPGVDVVGQAQASAYGVDEEAILDRVETYIHIGSVTAHGQKTLLERPHRSIRLAGLVGRGGPERDIIHVWDRSVVR